jgi:hypothetical protein
MIATITYDERDQKPKLILTTERAAEDRMLAMLTAFAEFDIELELEDTEGMISVAREDAPGGAV